MTGTHPEATKGTGVVSFAGHETFALRHGWLKKAVDSVHGDPEAFTNENAMVELGVGKNMVRAIRHWALATQVLAESPGTRGRKLHVTALGEAILGDFGADPFMEDPNTLWLLHWKLATHERRSTTWAWAFNLIKSSEFSRDSLLESISLELKNRNIVGISEGSLKRDIDCFLRSYVTTRSFDVVMEDALECPFVELQLISPIADGSAYLFNRNAQVSLSDDLFAYALVDFWAQSRTERQTLSFSEIAFGIGSPGLAFKIDENSIMSRLERLNALTNGTLDYSDTAGLKQVYKRGKLTAAELLNAHFEKNTHAGDLI